MKQEKTKKIAGAMSLVALALLLAAGCTSTKSVADKFPDDNRAVIVTISKPGPTGPIEKVKNMKDPQEIINLARNLSAAGRHKESALIYLDAAKRFHSIGKEFEKDCKKAAVREFCLNGNFVEAKDQLRQLEKEQDVYGLAYETEDFKKLRELINATENLKNN